MWRQALNDSFQAENRPSDPNRHTSKTHTYTTCRPNVALGLMADFEKTGNTAVRDAVIFPPCFGESGPSWLIDLFPCGTRVSDNDPLVPVASVSRLQSALHLSRSLYGQKPSKHTHTHTRVTPTPPLSDTAVHTNKTSHSTKASGE